MATWVAGLQSQRARLRYSCGGLMAMCGRAVVVLGMVVIHVDVRVQGCNLAGRGQSRAKHDRE